ncbi:23S rRNA (Uracil-5-) -methyltransferase rumB [Klebsiella pneumoniae subsp. pneumoniae]|nr:23S rRNA (Uracil-5-) -methyltransferase rumB [Klebsiella pneumoniae subsp. pneumoniae]
MMLRFVLRSEAKVAQLRAALPWLQAQLPQLSVITANIQPVHMAIMEGEQEIFFTEQQALGEVFNGVPLWIRPQSFLSDQSGGKPAGCTPRPATGCARCRSSICGICFAALGDLACTARRRRCA